MVETLNQNITSASLNNLEQEKKNMKTVKKLIDILNTGNIDKVHELIHDEYFNHESNIDISNIYLPSDTIKTIEKRSKLRGLEEFIDTVKSIRNAFSGLLYKEKEICAMGEIVFSRFIISGIHTGTFFIFPPSGNKFTYQAVHIHRFLDDKVIEHKAVRDDLTFMMQLGLVQPIKKFESFFNFWKQKSRQ
ncbi:MAG TPA: ester cyclase [Verrucomicrobiae bacterium]|nr:ester cyclase [Verrucomicrobiae bacterium]